MTDCFLRYHVNEAIREGKLGLLKESEKYFNHVMEVIRENHYDGPITTIPG